jgi:hypothetical protein
MRLFSIAYDLLSRRQSANDHIYYPDNDLES